ncbi:unnamed protein product [Paramecium octaurelia]|uniref:Uncharacterized protein n=1 Tax=Paramecium octaurelia TaxID=43137 RepID=A0A8S1SQP8_PAROT|nr:unnamed protein product [Paramecium octaurelia]
MNQIYDLMQIIKTSQQRGQELMIDSFVIGYLFGKGNLKNKEDLQIFIEQLNDIKHRIDVGDLFPSSRDELILSRLGNLSMLIKGENNNDKYKQQQKKKQGKGKGKTNILAQTTPINPQTDLKDQNELNQFQEEDTEKQQIQMNSKKPKTQQPQKQGVQTRQQIAQQQKKEQQKDEQQKDEQQKNE